MRRTKEICSVLSLFALAVCLLVPSQLLAADETVQWINHLEFLPGDSEIMTAFNAGLGGLEVTATATGENFIEQGVQVSTGYLVTGVRVCYALDSATSFINQISLAQLQDPPGSSLVLLDDMADQTDMGPVCVNSAPPFVDPIDPSQGALSLRLGVDFTDVNNNVVILGVGLLTVPDPNSPILQALQELKDDLQNHTHNYLTGRGVGHNKVIATTGGSNFTSDPPEVTPMSSAKKKKNNR